MEECQETWEVLSLEKDNWELVGDVQIPEKASWEIIFYRDVNEKKLTGDIGGAAWYKINRNNMEGINISFTPSITIDYNFYGNVKYPQGFAFVFMSNAVSNALGEKRSGIGYDGLNNAVAFEFDFLQNSDKNDIRDPHFSAHYKFDGQIYSVSPPSCLNFCNIALPNFYDSQRPNYQKDIRFHLEIYGGKLFLRADNQRLINGIEFPHLDTLMEKNEVYFGITASMNLYKSVSLKNLNVSKIQTAKIPELHIVNAKESYEAGMPLQLSLKLKSKCGVPLKIFKEEFKKSFSLEVDYENWQNNFDVSYEDNQRTAILSLNKLTKAKIIKINHIWKDQEGSPIELEIGPGDKTYYDICNSDYDQQSQFLKAKVTDSKEFTFSICSTDQYRNPKISKHLSDDELVRIGFPYLVPPVTGIKILAKENQTKFDISVPLTAYGDYTIYNEKFFNGPKKFFRVSVLGMDLGKSYGEINGYVINKNTQVNKPVVLYIKAKDDYGTDITIDQLNSLSCSLENSKIQHRFKSETKFYDFVFRDGALPVVDGYAALTFDPLQPGEYTFLPKIRCGKATEPMDLKCELCTFFIASTVPDTTRFKLFSDFKNRDFISNELNQLIISLDEAKNEILTTLRIIDTSGVEIRQPNIEVSKISASITLGGKNVVPIEVKYTPAGIDLTLNSSSDRTQLFSPLQTYNLNIKISDVNFQTNGDFNIPVKFSYKDRYLNNINKLSKEDIPENFLVTFIPGTSTIRAARNRLLFKIFARNSINELTMGDSLDPSKTLVSAIDEKGINYDLQVTAYKSGYFLYISGSPKKSGNYQIQITYNDKKIYSMNLTVTPRDEVSSLLFDSKIPIIKSVSDTNEVVLNDVEVDQTPSFSMQMVDEFQNVIDHNYLEIFNQITIKNIGDVNVQPNVNGNFVVIFSGRQAGISQVSLELSNGKVYQVSCRKTSLKIDPTNSITKLIGIRDLVGNPIKARLNLFDYFNSEISENINNNEDALKEFKLNSLIYLAGPSGSLTQLKFEAYKQDGFYFTTEAGKEATISGEYQLKAYYKNVSIKCEVCSIELTPDVFELSKTSAYWLGANSSIQLNSKYYNMITNKEGFTIYLVFKDKYGNEIQYDGKYDLVLKNEDESALTPQVHLCRITQNPKKRQYFQTCSAEDQKAFSELSTGNYIVKVDDNTFKFKIYESQFEPTENQVSPSNKYSYIVNDDNNVSGTIDIPARMIIDLRSENNLRYSNIDKSQIKISLTESGITDFSFELLQDSPYGLITAVISSKYSGKGKLSVSYADNLIISDISYKNSAGEITQMVYSDISYTYSKGRVYVFTVNDASKASCSLHNNKNIIDNLIMVSSKKGIIAKEIDFNPLNCYLTVKIHPQFTDELTFDSKLLSGSVKTNSLTGNLCTDHSFVYLEDVTETEINSKAVLKLEALDLYSNKISYDKLKTEANKLSVLVLLKYGNKAKYISTVKAISDDESKNVFFTYDLKSSGDYTFIPLYDDVHISCISCNKKVTIGSVDLSKTKIQIKKGSNWNDKENDLPYVFFQNTFPFFKLNFRDFSNSQVDLVNLTDYTFTFSVDSNDKTENILDIEIYQTQKNGVFLYLNESGRNKYLDLNPLDKLKLTIQNKNDKSDSTTFNNFLILNDERDTPSDVKCQEDAVPIFSQLTDYSGYIEAGYDFIQEFYLEGCQSQKDLFFNDSEFTIYRLKDNKDIQRIVIPTDVAGNYLLILTSKKATSEPLDLRLKFKSSRESEKILFNVLPSSQIGKFVYSSAGNFYSSSNYAYFYVTAYDNFGNLLSNDQISFVSSDLNLDIRDTQNNKVFYKVSFDTPQNKFLIEVPVISQGNLIINSKYSENPYTLQINNSNSLRNSLVTVINSDIQKKQFEVKIDLRDEFYIKYQNIDIHYTNSFHFLYYTYNPITEEEIQISLTDVKQKDPTGDSNILLISIPENIPVFKYAVVLPLSTINTLSCDSCLVYNNLPTKPIESIVTNDQNSTPSMDDADASKSVIYSPNFIKFKAGKAHYFFIEARDSNNKLTNKTPTIGISNPDIKSNVIQSSVAGFYLVEVSSDVKINLKLVKIFLNGQTVNYDLSFEVESGFPVSFELKSLRILNSNTVAYNVVALDAFKNNVCDERINLSAKLLTALVPQTIAFDSTENTCVYYFFFSGMAVINSPFLQTSDVNRTIQNFSGFSVSSFESSLILDQNNSRKNSPINFNFNLISVSGLPYPTHLIEEGMSIKLYRILDFNCKILVKEIKNLSSQINSFSPDNLNIIYGDYLLYGVVNGVELKNFSPFRYYKSFIQEPNNIQLKVKHGNEWELINPLYDANSATYSRIRMPYPFSFMINIMNSDNQIIHINDDTKIEAKLLLDPITDPSLKLFDLEGIPNSETSFLIEIPKNRVTDYLHLPKGNYIFVFSIKKGDSKAIEKWLPIEVKQGLFQNNNLNVPYALPGDGLATTLDIVSSNNEDTINANVGSYSKTNLCIKSNDKIYNEYLEAQNFVINNLDTNNCSLITSTLLRGCIDLFVYCKNVAPSDDGYLIKVTYNNISIKTSMRILIDPQLPPKNVELIEAFKDEIEQKTEIAAQFNLLDSSGNNFKYLSQDNFEVFVNNKILEREKWIVWFNKNLNLKILNVDYPPRKQNVQVYFKDIFGYYTSLSELNSEITVTQGSFDPRKSTISLPVSYYAGDSLEFVILLRDNFNNCFEDDLNLDNIKIRGKLGDSDFEKFQLTQTSINFPFCKRIITVKVDDSPFKLVGSNKIELLYQEKSIHDATLSILPNKLSPEKSELTVVGAGVVPVAQVQAGVNLEILMKGTDAYSNKVSYYDLVQKLDINIDGLEKNTDYFFFAYNNETNESISMNLMVNKLGRYKLTYLINNEVFINKNGLTDIIVTAGKCSAVNPKFKIHSNLLFTGDYGVLEISCLDDYNNAISVRGEENFQIEIRGHHLEVVGEDKVPYELIFNSGVYTAKFLLAYKGEYSGQIYLNGNLYGNSFVINVQSRKCPTDTPVMCSDRKCVKNISDCTDDVDSYNCQTPEKPFLCKINGESTCVSKLSECDCSSGFNKCNGMCIPKEIGNICSKPISTNCQRKLPFVKDPLSCPDGSCRTNSRCPNPMGCPIGYKPCGSKCIRRKTQCLVQTPKCTSSQVVCWDLSCADSLDSCPTAKTCNDPNSFVCPDGKCVSDVTQCTQPPECSAPFNYLCPDFTCKKSELDCNQKSFCYLGQSLCENNQCADDCSKISSCPSDKYLCPNGQCVENYLLCPTSLSCPSGTIKCPTGSCASSYEECKFTSSPSLATLKTCPQLLPILCPDLSCVSDISDCKNIPSCPANKPYRCPNNECRKSRSNCPSITNCPADFPVLCEDGSCQKASYHCSDRTSNKCDGYKCWNGSCVSSISLCPNEVSCGSNQIKCWDGACVNDIKECRDPKYIKCPDERPFRCGDGSCRIDKKSCSTVSICPTDRPVKCYDNSCKESIDLCPAYQPCGKNMKSCPDGTCTSDKCNTNVTCPQTMPFLCYDNTCAIDIRDCRTPPKCDGVFCPDGSCVSNRLLCKFFEPCSPNNPVRCQHGSCAASVEDCYSILRECPIGYVKCQTGGCKINESMCKEYTCPENLPYLCPEGVCALGKGYCDDPFTGCPYNKKYKCIDGTCVKNINECMKYSQASCPKNSVLCSDGSCRQSFNECPLQNGCPKDKPIKCANGVCVDPFRTVCSVPSCPFNLPIQCPSGECVTTTSNCPSSLREQDFKDCKDLGYDDHFMCADGRCVPTPDFCRPLYKCPDGFTKCPDGTCKLSSNQCQSSSNCPSNRPARCPFGKCVAKESDCFTTLFCPNNFPILCDKNRECVSDSSECPKKTNFANGCPKETPIKCLDGRCMATNEQCKLVDIACSVEYPVLCPDGSCKTNRESCNGTRDACPNNYTRCPDGTCVEEKSYMLSCKNKIGCPLVKPIRCTNGSCAANELECKSTISCYSDFPVLCADLSCAADPKFCNVLYPCKENFKRCNNGFCVKYENECEAISGICPLSSPVKCPTGRCTKSISDCSAEYAVDKCKEKNQFFCTRTSECVNTVAECVGANYAAGSRPGTSRLLQQTNENSKVNPENQCLTEAPYSCYDGTCRKKREDCPILAACGIMEYRCSNGTCQKDPLKCKENSVLCEPGLNKCEDGLCRVECPAFNGCGLATPFQCSNGMCVNNLLECIGFSMCENSSNPFRCIDGTCVSDPNKCPDIKRLNSAAKQTISISTLNNIDVSFAYDRTNRNIGRIYIPANSLRSAPIIPTNFTTITFEEVPHSSLYQYYIKYNNTEVLLYDISNGIVGSDGILDFENSVYSSIVKISGSNLNENFNYPGVIYLENNYLAQGQFKTNDYCLAKLENNQWNCLERKTSNDQTSFKISSFGIFAVVLNPLRPAKTLDQSVSGGYNFFFENLKVIIIVLGSLFFSIVIIFYVFSRIIRYREKYKENKEKLVNMKNQMDEYKNMSTDIPGQTLGDTIAGIIFQRNPAHSVMTNTKGMLNDSENEIEELQRKCKMLETQNRSIEERIEDVNEEYRMLKQEIERIKRKLQKV